ELQLSFRDASMACDVAQRLLRHAIDGVLDWLWQPPGFATHAHGHAEAELMPRLCVRAQCGNQAEVFEHHWPLVLTQLADTVERAREQRLDTFEALRGGRRRCRQVE